jgi:hypothetical protein
MGRQSSFIVVVVITALGGSVGVCAQAVDPSGPPASERRLIPIPRPVPPMPPRPPGDGWVWVPPTYRIVYERVWQEAVYREVTEPVWVPDEYGWRTVECWEDGVSVHRQVWTVVRPGYWGTQTRRELVSPGGWVYRERRELVTPGHWEWRGGVEGPVPVPLPQPMPPRTPAARPPGLEPFSPLWEWPEDKKG